MKHQSISEGARVILLCHILHLCFICTHIPFTHTHLHILAQPELAVTRRNLPLWYHPLTTFHLWCYCSKGRPSRHNVLQVCASCLSLHLTELQKWATETCSTQNIPLSWNTIWNPTYQWSVVGLTSQLADSLVIQFLISRAVWNTVQHETEPKSLLSDYPCIYCFGLQSSKRK